MPQHLRSITSLLGRYTALIALLTLGVISLVAQHTTVQDAGGGRKLETDFNADGQATETRSLGPDGKLQQKVVYERRPGYYTAQQTTTSYFPDGKVQKVTRVTYDPSANFTGEFIQVYDESGKQVAGHRLTHDPMTNVYICKEWNTTAQDYKPLPCPAGEEEAAGAEQIKKFTYEEVVQHLAQARQAAITERKRQQMQPLTPIKPPITTANKDVGIVLPRQIYAGERISGSLVSDPDQYDGLPGVTVTRATVPFESVGEASGLAGWNVEAPGEQPQSADGPITLVVPRGASQVNLVIRQKGNPDHSVSKTLDLSANLAKGKAPMAKSYKAPALCLKSELCTVSGPFSGDGSKTFAAFEERPATVVAETRDTAYISIPERTEAGSRPLFLAEGQNLIALPVTVGYYFVKNVERELEAGQTLVTFPTLDGPSDIPDEAWRSGDYPSTNLAQAQALVPGFQVPRNDREAHEKAEAGEKGESKEQREAEEKKGGMVLVVVKNMTPEQINLRGAKNQMITFHLNDASFSRGEFKYDLIVEAVKTGHFGVRMYVIPFLAPVPGQEFANKESSAGK